MPPVTFRVLRPADLVDLRITAHNVEISTTREGRVLTPLSSGRAYMIVQLATQHLGERASYEITTACPDPVTGAANAPPGDVETPQSPPINVLAAKRSRLVFGIPAGERIPMSSEGVLAAMGRLPLLVAPTAAPRPLQLVPLPGGLVRLGSSELVRLGSGLLALSDAAAPAATTSLHAAATAMRTTRALLASRAAVDLRSAAGSTSTPPRVVGRVRRGARSLLGPGGLVVSPGTIDVILNLSPRAPHEDETAIEAPWRLTISPSDRAGFAHANQPERSQRHPELVELWHTRLGVRRVASDQTVSVDERDDPQRIVRAIWNREKDTGETEDHALVPFRTSLDRSDRGALVRQTADWTLARPDPADARRLELSALGAWLDLHGQWKTTPYTQAGLDAILSWDHVAPMGRDQFVRVVYPGFLFPFGHRASLVKITERKIKDSKNPQARLYQRKFLVIGEPERLYSDRRMPFVRVAVRPLVTPDIKDPMLAGGGSVDDQKLFWPTVETGEFLFTLDAIDHEGRTVRLYTPLLWVADQYVAPAGATANRQKVQKTWNDKADSKSLIPASAQRVAFAPAERGGDTTLEAQTLRFEGTIPVSSGDPHSEPTLTRARVVIPAMQRLASRADPVDIEYAAPYVVSGFSADPSSAQVFAKLITPKALSFSDGTDRSGGFLQPDLPIAGLSRRLGLSSNGDGVGPQFDASAFTDVLPKLFGVLELKDLLGAVGLDEAPRFVQDLLDQVTGFLGDLERLVQLAKQAAGTPAAVAGTLQTLLAGLRQRIQDLFGATDESVLTAARTAITGILSDTRSAVQQIADALAGAALTPVLREQIQNLCTTVRAPLEDAAALIEKIFAFVQGLLPRDGEVRARYEWRPTIKSWPASGPLFRANDPHGLVLAVEARTGGAAGARAQVLAELRDFDLVLLPASIVANAELLVLKFERISFRSGTGRRTEVDVVFKEKEFLGVLGYLAKLSEWIPMDGFSDPPYFDVDETGIRAGFSLALPSIAIGVFSLENLSFAADVHVPFLGESITVGFSFCSRERPFVLTVMCIGGGGFFGLRLSPKKLELLEVSLEARAQLGVDFGVASGSISAAVGVYIRMEGDTGSLTGYFRLRGEVNVLAIASASIELYLELVYQFDTGKMVGRARLTIEVEVFCFSVSVSFEVERRFAGSAGDPTFLELLGADEAQAALRFSEYCLAFAGA